MRLKTLLEATEPFDFEAYFTHDLERDINHIDLQSRGITSLKGCPPKLDREFDISNNQLTSLEYAPKVIEGAFNCSWNKLTSLEHCPEVITHDFHCTDNYLTSLKGVPEKLFYMDCSNNQINTIEGFPKQCYTLNLANNKLTSLAGIHKVVERINGHLDLEENPIKSHVLGLLKIKDLHVVFFSDKKLEKIISKHIEVGRSRNIFDCQAELEDAGFEEFAQL